MTPAELEQAMRQFEAQGGKVEVLKGFEGVAPKEPPAKKGATRSDKTKSDSPEVVEALRKFVDLGVYAASKALRKKPETINRIAERHGIEFNTSTGATRAKIWAEREKMIPHIKTLGAKGLSQSKICLVLGISRMVLRTIAERHGININSRAKRWTT